MIREGAFQQPAQQSARAYLYPELALGDCRSTDHANDYTPAGAIQDAAIGTGISLHRDYNKRLLAVDEYDYAKTTPGSAIAQITGAEQEISPSTGSITFGGAEQSAVSNGQTVYDGGNFVVSINGGTAYQIQYGQNSTPQSLAAALATDIGTNCASVPVTAVANGATVFLTSCSTGAADRYSLSAYFDGNESTIFPTPSFQIMASGATMTQAASDSPNEPMSTVSFSGTERSGDSGNFTIAFYNSSSGAFAGVHSVNWGSTDTPQTLAASFASSFQSCASGSSIAAAQNNNVVTLTSCTSGTSYVENIAMNHNAPGNPSFSAEADAFLVTTTETYDSGTVALAINGTQVASTAYGPSSTPTTIVSGLVSASSNNTLVTLAADAANPSYLNITAKGGSGDSNYTYALSFTYNSGAFTQPSFGASSASGTLQGAQNAPLYSWAINNYAPDGDVLQMTDSVMGTWTYGYDDMDRLVTGSASAGSLSGMNLSWSYDRYGNRWTQSASGSGSAVQTSFTFTGNNNRIDQYSSNYDADGNLQNDGTNNYTYDAENRIIAINGQATYLYDAEGTRVAKLGSGGAVAAVYVLGSGNQQISELNSSGQWAHSNIFAAGGKLLATYEGPAGSAAAGYHYHLTDWLGTERLQTNSGGNEDEACVSYPFGDGLSCSGPAAVDATEHHFTGKERDSSGLDYFGARYLSSNFARFMTPDWAGKPANVPYANFGDPQSLNLYAYVSNNPNTGIDTDGHYDYGAPDTSGAVEIDGITGHPVDQGTDTAASGSGSGAPAPNSAASLNSAASGGTTGQSDKVDRAVAQQQTTITMTIQRATETTQSTQGTLLYLQTAPKAER